MPPPMPKILIHGANIIDIIGLRKNRSCQSAKNGHKMHLFEENVKTINNCCRFAKYHSKKLLERHY